MRELEERAARNRQVYEITTVLQESFREPHLPADLSKKPATEEQRNHLVSELWSYLQDGLIRIARRWQTILADVYGTRNLNDIALGMFTGLLLELPRLRIDPEKNPIGLLLVVADRLARQEYRRSSSMRRLASFQGEIPIEQAGPIVDLAATDFDENISAALDDADILDEIHNFMRVSLNKIDQTIIQRRMNNTPYKDIADRLGAGWTADAVRKRYTRAMQRVREHLRETQLLDGDSE